ncbi:Methionyl-tRNA formyltransferase [Coemansia sp. Benny D115]|nr:Methionyl-tRNA formyltransferase [Coemansia sp. Benny D115]
MSFVTNALRFARAPRPTFQGRRWFSCTPASNLRVLFFGSDKFARAALKPLIEAYKEPEPSITDIGVICAEKQIKNPHRPVEKQKITYQADTEKLAMRHDVRVENPPPKTLTGWTPLGYDGKPFNGTNGYDVGVVASFGTFIPRRIIEMFPKGMINVHPSLLPRYRGPSPLQTAILDKVAATGVTIQEVHPTIMDGGNILLQAEYTIKDEDKIDKIMQETGKLGGELARKCLENLDFVRKHAIAQREDDVTITKMMSRINSQIIWETMTAEEINRMHRAFYMQEPVFTFFRTKNKVKLVQLLELKVADKKKAPIDPNYVDCPPGTVFRKKLVPYLEINCIDGSRLHVTSFKVASAKATLDSFQFAAGYIKPKGTMQVLSHPVDTRRPTPEFIYPVGYVKPEPEGVSNDKPKTKQAGSKE